MACIAFIGLGKMGSPMVSHLLRAGHQLRLYARRPEATIGLQTLGASLHTSPAEAAAGADFVLTNVTSTPDVEAVLLGNHGVIHGAAPGTLCVDHSTISAPAARQIAQQLAISGIEFIDAPVSGGEQGAIQASLSIMVGGSAANLARAKPVLTVLGSRITHIGDIGAGQIAKACNQLVQVINIQGIAEAMYFAQAHGVALLPVLEALSAGMAGSKMLDLMGPKMAARQFQAGIEARLHAKDFGLIHDIANAAHLSMPAMQVVHQQLQRILEAGWGYDDTSSLLRVLEQAAAPSENS